MNEQLKRSANDRQVGGSHYESSLQHWDVIEEYGVGYLEGCSSKYVTRTRKKNGLQDLEKAVHYIEKLLEMHRGSFTRMPRGQVPLEVCFEFAYANALTAREATIVTLLLTWQNAQHLELAHRLASQLYDDSAAEQQLAEAAVSIASTVAGR